MDPAQLTHKQKEFFNFICDYKKNHEIWPTYREIADRFDYKSPNSVTQNLQALLNGKVRPNAQTTSWRFEYGLTSDYGKQNSRANALTHGLTGAGAVLPVPIAEHTPDLAL
jgi:repressor LexA